ncbi:MAG: hypothetical protein BGN86_02550 [Caulobacterales bacterium 68-7]|nr:DUF3089 domain-containing protein [Caulobacterales bacterium]OJU09561.1 MAG: hypothetical protein BGN86_02550 [Caulobacterales bacterium 68-7]
MAVEAAKLQRCFGIGALALIAVMAVAGAIWRDDILRTALDPKVPFQTYDPPPAPNYEQADAWALRPGDPLKVVAGAPPADVFFIHPTTYDGGPHWNAPLHTRNADRLLSQVMLPNYAGPFFRTGRLFAPRYRQASLYTLLTLRDDAREARRFAYGDIRAAFRLYAERYNHGRPFILVGVEQGGSLAARLLREEVATNPALAARLAGAYLIQSTVPAADYTAGAAFPACERRNQAHCVVAWAQASEGDVERAQSLRDRALAFDPAGQLVDFDGREALCVNPLTGSAQPGRAGSRLNLGAANATGLEWGARPAFLQRQVSAQCDKGVLIVSKPKSQSLRPARTWAESRRAPGYNLFYADLEADSRARVAALADQPAAPAVPGD